MFLAILIAYFKFRNRFSYSNGPIKQAGKVCGTFHDLKSPGWVYGGKAYFVSFCLFSDSFTLKRICAYLRKRFVNNLLLILIFQKGTAFYPIKGVEQSIPNFHMSCRMLFHASLSNFKEFG